jgi:hypothetical protein
MNDRIVNASVGSCYNLSLTLWQLRVLLGTKRGLVFSTLRAETKVVGPKFEYRVKIFLLSIAYRGSAIRSLLSRTFTMILQQYYNHCVVSLKSRV